MLSLKTKDNSGSFRCYRTSKLAELDFGSFRSYGYSFQEEILWRLKNIGATFAETPITFVDRQKGQSKINGGEAWEALRVIFKLGLRNWTGRK
jgi:dolichol-phosphate mannosyltransferase